MSSDYPLGDPNIGKGFDVDAIKSSGPENTYMGKAIKGNQLPSSIINTVNGPYLKGADLFTSSVDKLEKANPQEAKQALAANFVARNTDGNPFNTSDTSEQKSFLQDIQIAGYAEQAIKQIFPENESNSGFQWGEIG